MSFQPSLAARASNADTAIRGVLRGNYDDWISAALTEGVEACRQLLAGIQTPNQLSYFTHPETREGVLFLQGKYYDKSGALLEQLVGDLVRIIESQGRAAIPIGQLSEYGRLFRQLSRRICEQDQILERTLA